MKILKKIILILVIMNCILVSISLKISKVYASISDEVSGMTGTSVTNDVNISDLKSVINKLLGFLQVATGICSVIAITFTGFDYVVAPTPEMQGEIKKKMFPMVIGIVCVFGASSIARFIIGTFETTN